MVARLQDAQGPGSECARPVPYGTRSATSWRAWLWPTPEYPPSVSWCAGAEIRNVGLIPGVDRQGNCAGASIPTRRRAVLARVKQWEGRASKKLAGHRDRQQGAGIFSSALRANIVSQVVQLGDAPNLDKLIGPVKGPARCLYAGAASTAVYLAYSRFINTMKQETVIEQLLAAVAASVFRAKRG